jgi:Flp pilus assembly pilin Flp
VQGEIAMKDTNERSNWIAREGSGHSFVEYVIILCCVSIVSAILFSFIGSEVGSMYQGFNITIL